MNSGRPGTETEYSRARAAAGGDSGRPRPLQIAVPSAGALGAALLLLAEFTPLLQVHSSARPGVVSTLGTGAHHSYALVPVALLAAVLAYGVWRTASRLALLATGVLGVLALLIALLGDLPDAQASGLVGTAATRFASASSSPAIGLYLETLGAIVLLICAVSGLVLLEAPEKPPLSSQKPPPGPPRADSRASRTRSAS